MILEVSLWSGIVALYLGIAGAVGVFSRQAITGASDRLAAATYSLALFLPASALVLAMTEWSVPIRIALAGAGVFAAWAAYTRPSWLPSSLWRRSVAHRYLAGAMALAAVWGISQAYSGSTAAPLLITVSAIAAGAASTGAAPGPHADNLS